MSGNDANRMTSDELEQALAGMVPTTPEIDRDALMYRAGYVAARGLAAERRTVRFWQGSTVLMTAASVALAITLWQRPSAEPQPQFVKAPTVTPPVEAVADHETPSSENSAAPVAQSSPQISQVPSIDPLLLADPSKNYLALRAVVLRRGVDAWPVEREASSTGVPAAAPTGPSTVRGLMEELLPPPPSPKRSTNDNPNEASTRQEEPVV